MELKVFLAGGEWWKASDFKLGDVGVIISEPVTVPKEYLGKKKEVLECLFELRGEHKKLTLNKGNAFRIAAKYGTDSAVWVGKACKITPSKAQVGKELKDSIIMEPL